MKNLNKNHIQILFITGLFIMLSVASNTYSQNYYISFAATGASTSIDSIKVENLTHLKSLTIPGGDLLCLVLIHNSIDKIGDNSEKIQVNPNPNQGQAEILFYAKHSGNAQVVIFDISGKEVVHANKINSIGIQKYHVTGLKQGQYIIKVYGKNYFYTVKMISQSVSKDNAKIEYIGTEKTIENFKILKSSKFTSDTINMYYITGDNLRFKGYSGIYTDVVTDVPTSSKTITFNFNGLPTLTTTPVSSITNYTAVSGGYITSDGGYSILVRGVCWNISPNPVISNTHTSDGTGTGIFTSTITGLSINKLYYVRAYATNSYGTAYGNELYFWSGNGQPCPGIPMVFYLGKTYNTVQIKNQCWLKENLDVGTQINGSTNQTNNGILEKYCYNNDTTNCKLFGGLYQWDEMMKYMTTSGAQGICPNGWHIPTNSEWDALIDSFGGSSVAGGKLKEIGTTYWLSPNTGATNESGFTAFGGGSNDISMGFRYFKDDGHWWSSVQSGISDAYYYAVHYDVTISDQGNAPKISGLSVRCIMDSQKLSTLTTLPVSSITNNTAISGGNITSDGGCSITSRGVCWSTSPNPAISDSHTINGTGTGLFTSNITGLSSNKLYYVRAYATNCVGTAYGNELYFWSGNGQPCPGIPTVFYLGKTYNTVQIKNQCWLRENLDVGTQINGSTNQTNNGIIEKYCYNNDTTNCKLFGGLYQWDEMMKYTTTSGAQGICPNGWHIPTNSEWDALIDSFGGSSVAGGKLKEIGTTYWLSPNTGATNESGFTAFGGGSNDISKGFRYFKDDGHWWSSVQSGISDAYYYAVHYDVTISDQGNAPKISGLSVRCIKD